MGRKQKKQKPVDAERSEIIEQCVIYLQSKAAWLAGFEGDTTWDGLFAGSGKGELGRPHLRKADQAFRKLVGLSPAYCVGRSPLKFEELKAKAIVCRVMEESADTDLTQDERCFVRFFVREVEDLPRGEVMKRRRRSMRIRSTAIFVNWLAILSSQSRTS